MFERGSYKELVSLYDEVKRVEKAINYNPLLIYSLNSSKKGDFALEFKPFNYVEKEGELVGEIYCYHPSDAVKGITKLRSINFVRGEYGKGIMYIFSHSVHGNYVGYMPLSMIIDNEGTIPLFNKLIDERYYMLEPISDRYVLLSDGKSIVLYDISKFSGKIYNFLYNLGGKSLADVITRGIADFISLSPIYSRIIGVDGAINDMKVLKKENKYVLIYAGYFNTPSGYAQLAISTLDSDFFEKRNSLSSIKYYSISNSSITAFDVFDYDNALMVYANAEGEINILDFGELMEKNNSSFLAHVNLDNERVNKLRILYRVEVNQPAPTDIVYSTNRGIYKVPITSKLLNGDNEEIKEVVVLSPYWNLESFEIIDAKPYAPKICYYSTTFLKF